MIETETTTRTSGNGHPATSGHDQSCLDTSEWITVPEACAILGRSERTLRRYVKLFGISTRFFTTEQGQELRLARTDVVRVAEMRPAIDEELERVPARPATSGHAEPAVTADVRPRPDTTGHGQTPAPGPSASDSPVRCELSSKAEQALILAMDRTAGVTDLMIRLGAAWEREFQGKLVSAFKQALQEFDSERGKSSAPAPRRFAETRLGRVATGILYGLVGVMALGILAYSFAIARKFDLFTAIFR